ncbi:MAG: hypothetical protein JXQ73_15780 [Phycisphaerae bacterium]|nr:hypothetical protein [Phycisphaerae bacterium]
MTPGCHVVRPLQNGWWENVLLISVSGEYRVRKELHRLDAPWARNVLIKEWQYLRGLPQSLRPPFVTVLDQCQELLSDPPPDATPLWFDMEYLDGFTDVRSLLAQRRLTPFDADRIQALLIDALCEGLYRLPGEPFDPDRLVWPVMSQVLDLALTDQDLAPYARPDQIVVNGAPQANLKRTLPTARADDLPRRQFDRGASVRLHGDLFYENVLYRPDPPAIRLIDPVSVAGVDSGPVLFDRVKFASWLSGELYALRHGAFQLTADPASNLPRIDYAWSKDDPVIDGLHRLELGSRVLSAMDALTGPSEAAGAVLDAYFSLAMVANTPMPQKLLRYARAVERLSTWA